MYHPPACGKRSCIWSSIWRLTRCKEHTPEDHLNDYLANPRIGTCVGRYHSSINLNTLFLFSSVSTVSPRTKTRMQMNFGIWQCTWLFHLRLPFSFLRLQFEWLFYRWQPHIKCTLSCRIWGIVYQFCCHPSTALWSTYCQRPILKSSYFCLVP